MTVPFVLAREDISGAAVGNPRPPGNHSNVLPEGYRMLSGGTIIGIQVALSGPIAPPAQYGCSLVVNGSVQPVTAAVTDGSSAEETGLSFAFSAGDIVGVADRCSGSPEPLAATITLLAEFP